MSSSKRRPLKMKERVPVSVAVPTMGKLHGDAPHANPLSYVLKKMPAKGAGDEDSDSEPREMLPMHPLDEGLQAKAQLLRDQVKDGTIPRMKRPLPESGEELSNGIEKTRDILLRATRDRMYCTKKRKCFEGQQKLEILCWSSSEKDAKCLGVGYGSFEFALYDALDTALAGLVQRVAPKRKCVVLVDDEPANARHRRVRRSD
eukprot:TRINITY_DN35700_c0_g1_i1.p1 TRINITY_DN35700_c0_g1~~TRINITY_DN35700_c0_g1_i1.p1  ORF type:complete len:203 (+),score=44.90 TRINITY_DN35700_c0_g1_i1:62-670(+)